MTKGTITHVVEAGAVVRGDVKRELSRVAWECGLSISFEEEKGLLESVYRVTVSGAEDKLLRYKEAVETWEP